MPWPDDHGERFEFVQAAVFRAPCSGSRCRPRAGRFGSASPRRRRRRRVPPERPARSIAVAAPARRGPRCGPRRSVARHDRSRGVAAAPRRRYPAGAEAARRRISSAAPPPPGVSATAAHSNPGGMNAHMWAPTRCRCRCAWWRRAARSPPTRTPGQRSHPWSMHRREPEPACLARQNPCVCLTRWSRPRPMLGGTTMRADAGFGGLGGIDGPRSGIGHGVHRRVGWEI